MLQLPAISREYLYVGGIRAFDDRSPDGTGDPTSLPVQLALTSPGAAPATDAWTAGEWVDATTARILTGDEGDLAPTPGRYEVWLRVVGAVERPERPVGLLQVT